MTEYRPLRLFKTHELVYIGADERELMTLRQAPQTRKFQLYRLKTPPERARAILANHRTSNDLAAHPRFYNTLTNNSQQRIFDMARTVTLSIPLRLAHILTGHGLSYPLRARCGRYPHSSSKELRQREM